MMLRDNGYQSVSQLPFQNFPISGVLSIMIIDFDFKQHCFICLKMSRLVELFSELSRNDSARY